MKTDILVQIRNGRVTAKELGVPVLVLKKLEEKGFITQKGMKKTGTKGRPAFIYGLTRKGRDRARSQSKSKSKAA